MSGVCAHLQMYHKSILHARHIKSTSMCGGHKLIKCGMENTFICVETESGWICKQLFQDLLGENSKNRIPDTEPRTLLVSCWQWGEEGKFCGILTLKLCFLGNEEVLGWRKNSTEKNRTKMGPLVKCMLVSLRTWVQIPRHSGTARIPVLRM